MNMISTGSFLTETGASNKQSELVKKLTAAWEKKNSKTARAGGASLMALSLAACGGEDNTPFSQADVDAAKAEGVASVDITSDNTDVMLAQADYDAAIETAKTSNDADIAAAAKTEALTAANGTIYATVDAAYTAGSNVSNSDAVTAALTSADGTVHASVDAAITSNDASVETAATAAAETSLMAGTGFASVADLLTAYTNATAAPATAQALTTSADTVSGTSGNNTITGTASTFNTGDVISDVSSTDADVLTITSGADLTAAANQATVVGIETINFQYTGSGTSNGTTTDAIFEVAMANIKNGTVNFDATTVGNTLSSATITGVGNNVNLVFSDDFGTIIVDSSTDNSQLNVTTQKDGASITFQDASGTIDDVTLTADGDVTVAASTNDGDLTIVAAGDVTITDADVAAGAVSITSGGKLNIDGLEAATTVTLSGVGVGANKSDWTEGDNTAAVTTLNVSGNGGAFYLNAADGDLTALKTIVATGSQDVTVSVSGADVDGLTAGATATGTADQIQFTDNTTAGTTTLDFNTVGTIDTRAAAADLIQLSADFGNDAVTVGTGQTLVLATDQNGSGAQALSVAGAAATASTNSLTINMKDDTATTSANDAILTVTNIKELTINASDADTKNDFTSLNVGTTNNVTVNSTGKGVTFTTDVTANKLTLNTNTATTLASAINNSVAEVDASGSTAAITATSGTTLVTITTGSGNDVLTLGSATTNTTIDGGAGTDSLDLATGDYSAETITLSNIETLLMDNGSDVKASLLNGKSYVITDTTASAAINVIADTATVDLGSLAVDGGTIANVAISATAQATAGATINITGSNAKDTVDATGATGAVTLNLGDGNDVVTATGSGNDEVNTGAGDDTVTTTGSGADTIDLGAGGDTLTTAGAGNDTITAGEGADFVVGGGGADTIILTETTSAADYVIYTALTDGSAAGAGGGTFTGYDVITGFTANKDKILFDSGTVDGTVDTAIVTSAETVYASTDATAASNDLTLANIADVDSVKAFLIDVGGTGLDNDIVGVTFDDFTVLYYVADGGDAIDASDIKMIATVDEVITTTDTVI